MLTETAVLSARRHFQLVHQRLRRRGFKGPRRVRRFGRFESTMVVVQAEARDSHHTVDSGNRVHQVVELSGAADF